jgi:uncharacterized protein YycO
MRKVKVHAVLSICQIEAIAENIYNYRTHVGLTAGASVIVEEWATTVGIGTVVHRESVSSLIAFPAWTTASPTSAAKVAFVTEGIPEKAKSFTLRLVTR